MLQGLGTAAALQQFLGCRKRWVQQRLLQALSAAAQQDPGAVLAELAQQVQCCIAQVRMRGVSPACDGYVFRLQHCRLRYSHAE
jgi:hypothetical protein